MECRCTVAIDHHFGTQTPVDFKCCLTIDNKYELELANCATKQGLDVGQADLIFSN